MRDNWSKSGEGRWQPEAGQWQWEWTKVDVWFQQQSTDEAGDLSVGCVIEAAGNYCILNYEEESVRQRGELATFARSVRVRSPNFNHYFQWESTIPFPLKPLSMLSQSKSIHPGCSSPQTTQPKAAVQKGVILCWAPHLVLNGELLGILGQPSAAQLLFLGNFYSTPMTYNGKAISHCPVIIIVTFIWNEVFFPQGPAPKYHPADWAPVRTWRFIMLTGSPRGFQAPEDLNKASFYVKDEGAYISQWCRIRWSVIIYF